MFVFRLILTREKHLDVHVRVCVSFLNFIPQFLRDATDVLHDAKRIPIAIKTVAPVSREPKIYEVGEQKAIRHYAMHHD